ncbi:lipopolysaccharide biosynthesis protein [Pseudomonas kitaguniensis]|uniref:lipopolysaccharide biosynthesis protein n=1 Tax=Pseudomonas kitaguniensis TaxID=2607908 RepID=UPI003D0016C6
MTPKKILIFALGPLGAALLSFLTLPTLTWFVSVEDVGRVAMLQVLITFSFVVSSFGLDQAFVREYYDFENKGALFKAAFLPGFVFLVFSSAAGLFFFKDEGVSFFSLSSVSLIYLAVICLLINFVNSFLSHALRMSGKALAYSLTLIVPKATFLCVILLGIVTKYTPGFGFLLFAQTAALLSALMILIGCTRNLVRESFDSEFSGPVFKQLFSFGFPLVFGSIAYWALTMFDRIALSWWSTLSEVGVYSVGISFAAVGILFQSIFSVVWSPIVYKWASIGEDLTRVDSIVEHATAFVVFAFVMIGLFSFLVAYFLPPDYYLVQYIIGACMGLPLLYTLSETTVVGVHLKKRTTLATLAPVFALPTNIALAYWLIPLFGAAGAAVSTSVAMFVFLVIRTEVSIITWRVFPRAKMYVWMLLCLGLSSLQALHGGSLALLISAGWIVLGAAMFFSFGSSIKALRLYANTKFYSIKEI